MGKFKNLLKHFLPPPVNAFNREINSLRQLIELQNKQQMAKITDLEAKFKGGVLVKKICRKACIKSYKS